MNAPLLVPPKRCAVYCRVSSDERLDQSFNSIDAQKEAGQAFIKSQAREGWIPVADDYDDGGFTGGNMNRPALKRLMTDIEAGKVHIVVVYKIDRLSRSLADFARMVETFDRFKVSFSAVTQQINSATSMGRLMLNVLLSFAQFEREVTGERIRDKIAASKAKGMWMGGPLPLGYDVVSRLLVVNEVEAATVRRIFDDLVEERSATMMVRQLAIDGLTTKTGRKFCKQAIYKILHNRMYLGEINHKGKNYPGAHLPIITQQQWDDAHAVLDSDRRERWRDTKAKDAPASLLRGLIFAPDGERLMPTYTIKKGKTYRYYVPNRVGHFGAGASKICTIPAEPIEALVVAQVVDALSAPAVVQAVWEQACKSSPQISEPDVVLPMRRLASMWPNLFAAEQQRLVRLLIEKVVLSDSGLEIVWCDAGWHALSAELSPGTIGAELSEMEAA